MVTQKAVGAGLIILTTVIILYMATSQKVSFNHALVLEVASSKTVMRMFKWPIENTNVVEQVGDECETIGGIDDLDDDVETAIIKLVSCLNTITDLIEGHETVRTPAYLVATAGMRITEFKNAESVRTIMKSLGNFLANGSIKYNVLVNEIITGTDEGRFAWITVNYLLKTLNLDKNGPMSPVTVGILHFGGTSREIAYQDIHEQFPVGRVITAQLYGIDYKLHSSSDLCFGGDEVWKRHIFILVERQYELVDDPCMLKGSTINVMGRDLVGNPCLETKNGDNNHLLQKNYTLYGTGNIDTCLSIVNEILSNCYNKFTVCPEDEHPLLPNHMRFIATGYYHDVAKRLAIKEKITQKEFLSRTNAYCSQNWKDVRKEDIVKMDCLTALFIYETFSKHYKFNITTFENIEFVDKLVIDDKSVSISWTTGLIINSTIAIPSEDPSEFTLQTLTFSIVATVCGILFVIGTIKMAKLQRDIIYTQTVVFTNQ